MLDIYSFLNANNIAYKRIDHPAVFTCDQADKLTPMPGESIKNLFLYDKKTGELFLVIVPSSKRVDLKGLKKLLNTSNLGFANEELLQKYLGVDPGSVTVLGLIHDTTHKVTVIFDKPLESSTLQCHPLINTATLIMSWNNIEAFLKLTQHNYQAVDIPTR